MAFRKRLVVLAGRNWRVIRVASILTVLVCTNSCTPLLMCLGNLRQPRWGEFNPVDISVVAETGEGDPLPIRLYEETKKGEDILRECGDRAQLYVVAEREYKSVQWDGIRLTILSAEWYHAYSGIAILVEIAGTSPVTLAPAGSSFTPIEFFDGAPSPHVKSGTDMAPAFWRAETNSQALRARAGNTESPLLPPGQLTALYEAQVCLDPDEAATVSVGYPCIYVKHA